MKSIAFGIGLLWVLACTQSYANDGYRIEQLRMLFKKAIISEDNNTQLSFYIKHLSPSPTIDGYQAAVLLLEAKHSNNFFDKYKKFKQGRDLLEQSIAKDKQNPELRFLRLAFQKHIPKFLNYHSETAHDEIFLKQHLHTIKELDLKQMITTLLNN